MVRRTGLERKMVLIARTVSGSNSILCYSRWLPSKDWEKLIGAHFRQRIIHLKKAARRKKHTSESRVLS